MYRKKKEKQVTVEIRGCVYRAEFACCIDVSM